MIRIIAVGKIREKWIREGTEMFLERLGKYYRVEVEEVEEKDILRRIKDKSYVIACDEKGKTMGSEKFAGFLKEKIQDEVVFVIGGADGLPIEVKECAKYLLSLSDMTFTHEMARLFLAEQIYRAFTIMKGVKYHR